MLVLFETPAGYAIFKVRTGNHISISINCGVCACHSTLLFAFGSKEADVFSVLIK